MGSGAGTVLAKVIGAPGSIEIGIAVLMAAVGFFLIWFAEYEREIE